MSEGGGGGGGGSGKFQRYQLFQLYITRMWHSSPSYNDNNLHLTPSKVNTLFITGECSSEG